LLATLGAAVGKAADAIDHVALSSGRRLQDFSTTLLIGIARKTDDGYFFASISIGDGMIGVIADDATPLMMSPNARIHHCIVPDFTAFMLMTDGVSDPMFSSEKAAENITEWTALFEQIDMSSSDALCEWLHFKVKGEHDDRTIAIITPDKSTT